MRLDAGIVFRLAPTLGSVDRIVLSPLYRPEDLPLKGLFQALVYSEQTPLAVIMFDFLMSHEA